MKLDDHELSHHAARMLENPAWAELWRQVDDSLARERDQLSLGDERRQAVSVGQTVAARIRQRAAAMARPVALRDVNARTA